MKFEKLVAASEAVKQTRSRQQKVEHLAACIGELGAEPPPESAAALPAPASEIPPAPERTSAMVGVAYLAGELPQGRVGLGPAAVFANPPASARETGELSVMDVDRAFEAIAGVKGAGAVRERLRLWHGPAGALHGAGAGRTCGVWWSASCARARSRAWWWTRWPAPRSSPEAVRRAVMLSGSLPVIAQAALAGGEAALARYRIELFRPLQPMLAQTAETPEDALAALGARVRVQARRRARPGAQGRATTVRVYTRQLNDVTAAVPEIVEPCARCRPQSLVLDGEVIALRADGGRSRSRSRCDASGASST